MIEHFPYGKAPFWLLVLSIASTLVLVLTRRSPSEKPDIILTTFTPPHLEAYKRLVPEFERMHNVRVSVQLVNQQGLTSRLQSAMLAGTEVPDMVELLAGTMGFFVSGPLKDVGFTDLTDHVKEEHLEDRLVASRFSLWSSRNHVFALPHDVHPVALMYRADIVESLGIDVTKLQTWDDFVEMGRRVTKDLDRDGIIDRYAMDLPLGGGDALLLLLNQQDIGMFNQAGELTFNSPTTVRTIAWYLRQTRGANRIATECGSGQPFMKAMTDGLALFYLAPDWRTYLTQTDLPHLTGKMKVMPLPAWRSGGRRTSVWGGTGLAITKASKHQELDWELASFLYLNKADLGRRFAATNIVPPFKDAWDLPEFQKPNAYFSGQRLGAFYAGLAPSTPPVYMTALYQLATDKLGDAFLRSASYFEAHGDDGLESAIGRELDAAEAYVKKVIRRRRLATEEP